jgi:hypothetical protein
METPLFAISSEWGRLPLADVEAAIGRNLWLISDRCKAVFEAIDPGAFEFQAIEIIGPDGQQSSKTSHWLCDVVRYLDALDVAKSNARLEILADGVKRILTRPGSEVFRATEVEDSQVFRLMHAPYKKYVTEKVAEAIRAASLSGFMLCDGGKVDA